MLLHLAGATLVLVATPSYPRAELLIEPAGLMKAAPACILDVRGKGRYAEGHIPGAVWVDTAAWHRAFDAEASRASWARRLGEAGIDPEKTVVVYGDDVRDGARIWWILRYWGSKDVRLLNGGWAAWKQAGGKQSTETAKPQPQTGTFATQKGRLATKPQILADLKNRPPQIIDARSEKEYCGTTKFARKGGAIPGAIHLEWSECLDSKTGRFKTPDALAKLLKQRRIDVNQPAVTYCQSGGRAAVVAFTLELMGGQQVRNYYRSWSEWGNADDTPVQEKQGK